MARAIGEKPGGVGFSGFIKQTTYSGFLSPSQGDSGGRQIKHGIVWVLSLDGQRKNYKIILTMEEVTE